MFELVNKVVVPRSKKRTIASIMDLHVMECLSKFKFINLPAMMIQHIYNKKEDRHGMPYGFLLNMVFDYFRVVCEKGTPRTIKKIFTLTTLDENEYIKGKVGTVSQVSELLEVQENRVGIAAKVVEILKLKLKNQQLSFEGPGATEALSEKCRS